MEKWYKVSSMEPCYLRRARQICESRNIRYNYSDNGIDPPAIFMLCRWQEYMQILNFIGITYTRR